MEGGEGALCSMIGLTAPAAQGAGELTGARSRRCPLVTASVSSCPSSSLATFFRRDPNREGKGSYGSCSQGRLLFLSWKWKEKQNDEIWGFGSGFFPFLFHRASLLFFFLKNNVR